MVELIVDTYLKQDYKPRTKDLTTSVYSHPSGAGLCVIIISILFTNFMSLLHAKYGGMASVLTVGLDYSVGMINAQYTYICSYPGHGAGYQLHWKKMKCFHLCR